MGLGYHDVVVYQRNGRRKVTLTFALYKMEKFLFLKKGKIILKMY